MKAGLSWRWGLRFGMLYGLALMSKFNLAAIVITIELAVTWVAWRQKAVATVVRGQCPS